MLLDGMSFGAILNVAASVNQNSFYEKDILHQFVAGAFELRDHCFVGLVIARFFVIFCRR